MQAIKRDVVVTAERSLHVSDPTLVPGETVEVIVLRPLEERTTPTFPLRMLPPVQYGEPFEPVCPPEEWEALK